METRLIIAYSLIALLTALALFGVIALSKKRTRIRDRDAGRGSHN